MLAFYVGVLFVSSASISLNVNELEQAHWDRGTRAVGSWREVAP